MRTDPVAGVFLNEGDPVGIDVDIVDVTDRAGLVENGRVITDTAPTLDVDLDNPSTWKAFTGTVVLGMDHILLAPTTSCSSSSSCFLR